ncbi:hypothetical protein NLJ89_g3352 [Agrocybe chaxingu]|uniref:RNA helicase n=1 Tax=Agrocybe chaxingu TaxID=84603 RepID=A0A9W8MXE9_9AGAR|nr:hypothetical protein NLJ89_g3352 [Agrocybe chaxingu]
MSGDTTQPRDKKEKKTKSKGRAIELPTTVVEEPIDNDASEKLEKKRRTKSKIKSQETLEQDAPAEETAIAVDSEETPTEEPDKKKKKKKGKKSEESVNGTIEENGMVVDSEASPPSEETEKKKKKKRKREEDEGVEPKIKEATSGSKKERKEKKRRKEDQSSTSSSDFVPTTSAESSSAPSKVPSPKPCVSSIGMSSPASAEDAATFLKKHSVTIHTPSNAPQVTPVINFSQLDVPSEIRNAFSGFKEPTPIQACTWPPALEGRDVVGIAETGSGKTLAFGIPALCRLMKSPTKTSSKSDISTVSALVVAPTRELAIQTHDTLSAIGKPFGIASVAVFGGVPKEPQVKMLKNANKAKDGLTTRIIVGTPGRILDLMQEGACDLSGVDYLVLDEADRMLDKGFENDIRNIISSTKSSEERQTMMFSATWPESVRRLASTFQRDPVRVTVGSDDLTANSHVEQSVEVFDDARSKDQRLLNVLKALAHKKTTTTGDSEARILVFALYKKEASRVEQMLRRQGYTVGALHGDMSQNARMETLENFKNGKTGLMVATDVAARGDYIHRIGRTGRGGRSGKSITFFTGEAHERSLAGEFARVLREGGFNNEALKKFPMTIKKKEHGAYGAFFRDDIPVPKGPTKIVF